MKIRRNTLKKKLMNREEFEFVHGSTKFFFSNENQPFNTQYLHCKMSRRRFFENVNSNTIYLKLWTNSILVILLHIIQAIWVHQYCQKNHSIKNWQVKENGSYLKNRVLNITTRYSLMVCKKHLSIWDYCPLEYI